LITDESFPNKRAAERGHRDRVVMITCEHPGSNRSIVARCPSVGSTADSAGNLEQSSGLSSSTTDGASLVILARCVPRCPGP
jgi:hypothetical protein